MIVASAPGKLMLMGEHAVLYGHPCLVAAVSARATVQLTERVDSTVSIRSDLGEATCDLNELVVREPFTFILQAIKATAPTRGFDLVVTCDFPHDVGLGSSSAVTVAAVGALLAMRAEASPDPEDVFQTALSVVRRVQGSGSGADLAAAVHGGVIQYSMTGGVLKVLPSIPLTTVYSGSKEKTAVVIERVRQAKIREPETFTKLFTAVGKVVEHATEACEHGDLETLGRLMDVNQGYMDAMGVTTDALARIIASLRAQSGIFGAKISGSGLGDCAIGLGCVGDEFPYTPLSVAIDDHGLAVTNDRWPARFQEGR